MGQILVFIYKKLFIHNYRQIFKKKIKVKKKQFGKVFNINIRNIGKILKNMMRYYYTLLQTI